MELPLYLSFSEFEANYYNHLEQWFNEFHNSSEIDFLVAWANRYLPYVSYNSQEDKLQAEASIEVTHYYFSQRDNYGISYQEMGNIQLGISKFHVKSELKTISLMEYAQYVLDRIHFFAQEKGILISDTEDLYPYYANYEIISKKEILGYEIEYRKHQKFLPFLKAYLRESNSSVDFTLYRNFYFSVIKIAEYIDHKLSSVNADQDTIITRLKSENYLKKHFKEHNYLAICN